MSSLRTKFLLLAFILCIFVVQFGEGRFHADEDENDDGEYRFLKRLFFEKTTTLATQRTPSVLENLIRSSTTEKPSIWTQKTTSSSLYPSSGVCASHICEHGSICIPKGLMTYDCKCVGPWRGMYCGVADACYRLPCQNGGTCLNVYDDYWCKCTNDYYGTNCQTKVHSSTNSGNNCRPNICNTGRCVSLTTTYYCQCPNDRYGEHCEKRFSKRKVSNLQSYYDLLHQLKRGMIKQDTNDVQHSQRGEDVAFYDVKNGIYF